MLHRDRERNRKKHRRNDYLKGWTIYLSFQVNIWVCLDCFHFSSFLSLSDYSFFFWFCFQLFTVHLLYLLIFIENFTGMVKSVIDVCDNCIFINVGACSKYILFFICIYLFIYLFQIDLIWEYAYSVMHCHRNRQRKESKKKSS